MENYGKYLPKICSHEILGLESVALISILKY